MSDRREEKGEKKDRQREASAAEVREHAEATILGMKQALETFKTEIKSATNSASLISKAEALFLKAEQKINGLASITQIDTVKTRFSADLDTLKSNKATKDAVDKKIETSDEEKLQLLEFTFAEQSGEVLKAVTNMDTAIYYTGMEDFDPENINIQDEFGLDFDKDELVAVNAPFTKGIEGQVAFLLEKSLSAKVVDFTIMGDGEVEFMAEEHLEGIGHVVSQMMSPELARLSKKLNLDLDNKIHAPSLINLEEMKEAYQGWKKVKFVVEIEGHGSFRMWKLLSPDLVAKLTGVSEAPETTTPVEEKNPDNEALFKDIESLKKAINFNDVLTEEEKNNLLGNIKPDIDQNALEALGARFFVLAQEKYKNQMQEECDNFIVGYPELKDASEQVLDKYREILLKQTTVFDMKTLFARFKTELQDPSSAGSVDSRDQRRNRSNEPLEFKKSDLGLSAKDIDDILAHNSFSDFYEGLSLAVAHGMWLELGGKKYLASDLRDRAKNFHDGDKKVYLPEAMKNKVLSFIDTGTPPTPEDKSTEQIELIQKASADLGALKAEDYGENADKASELIQRSIDEVQALEKNLNKLLLERKIAEINADLELELEKLQVENPPAKSEQERLKLVDIKPEKIKEILESANVVAQLKDLLLQKEGAGSAGLQQSIVEVLQNYFAEQNLSTEALEALRAMIENLAAETSEQVTRAFASSLEHQAKIDSGWFDKVKQHMSALMGARLATTFAIGIGAAALAPVVAPMLGIAAVGWGTVGLAGGMAAFSRYFGNKIFTRFQKSEKNINKLKSKEEDKIDQRKEALLEENFINVDSLAAVMANTLRINTSEDFRTGQILDSEGNFSEEVAETLKANIQNLLDSDPRYIGLSPEEKTLKAKQLFTVLSMELIQQSRNIFDLDKGKEDPAMIKAMQRLQTVLSGKVEGVDKLKADGVFAKVGKEALQASAAGLVGAGLRVAYTHSAFAASATSALSGALMGWSLGSAEAKHSMQKQYYKDVEEILDLGESMLSSVVSNKNFENKNGEWKQKKFIDLQNKVINAKSVLSLKLGDNYILTDPVLRARAENFIHQFDQYKTLEISINESGNHIYDLDQNQLLKNLQRLINSKNDYSVEEIAKNQEKDQRFTKLLRYSATLTGAAIGGLLGFGLGGSMEAAENNTGVSAQETNTADSLSVASQDSTKVAADSLKQFTENPVDSTATEASDVVNNARTSENSGAGSVVENASGQAAGAVAGTHEVIITKAGTLENVIRTEDGMRGHDSIWSSTKDIVKSDPTKFGYTGDSDDLGSISKFAEIKTAELVNQLEETQGGDLADLVHNGDKVIVSFASGEPVLSFEDSSGIKAGHLPDFTAPAETPIPETIIPATPVAPEVPVASMENFISGKTPYSSEILKSIIDKPVELNTLAEKVFESAAPETQKQFLHDLYPDSFVDGSNKAAVFLHYVENAPDVNVKDLSTVTELDTWVKNFDAQANSDELPGKNWEVRLLTNENGKTFYAMVHEAKKHLFIQDEFVVDDINGHTWSLKEKALENWLQNSGRDLAPLTPDLRPSTETPQAPVAPIEPITETPDTTANEAPELSSEDSARLENIRLEGDKKLDFKYDEAGKVTGFDIKGRMPADLEALKSDFRASLETKLGNLRPDDISVVSQVARRVDLQMDFLNHLVENGQADTPEADFLADRILKNVAEVEKRYGDVFKDIKTEADGKLSFVEAVPANTAVQEAAPTAPVETPVEAPIETEISTGGGANFKILSQMQEGAKFYDTQDNVFTKIDGKIFRYDPLGDPSIEVKNQTQLDNLYKE